MGSLQPIADRVSVQETYVKTVIFAKQFSDYIVTIDNITDFFVSDILLIDRPHL